MTKRYLLIPTFCALLLVGCKQATPTTSQTPQDSVQQEAQEMATALESGGSAHCTITKAGTSEQAQIWIKDKKMRMQSQGFQNQTVHANMINDGEMMYVWEEGKTQGMEFAASAAGSAQAEQNVQEIPDVSNEDVRKEWEDKGYSLNCSKEAVADSQFVAPTDVSFADTSSMIKDTMNQVNEQMKDLTPQQQQQYQEMMKNVPGQ